MKEKERESIGAILTKESLRNIYYLLEGFDFILRDPIVKDNLWQESWNGFLEINQCLITALSIAEERAGNHIGLGQRKNLGGIIDEESWTENEALEAFKAGPEGIYTRYLLALCWLNNHASRDIQTRMENAYKVSHEKGLELPKAYESVSSEKLISYNDEESVYDSEIEKAISEVLGMNVN